MELFLAFASLALIAQVLFFVALFTGEVTLWTTRNLTKAVHIVRERTHTAARHTAQS